MIKHLIALAVATGAVTVAPAAHADTTMTVAEICEHASPGSPPRIHPFSHVTACSRALVPGLFMATPTVQAWMADNYVGSYPADPNNLFSDWIIPDGAGKAPPPDPSFRWREDATEEWKMCPPTCPSY